MKGFDRIASTEVFVPGNLSEPLGSLSEQYWLAMHQLVHYSGHG